MGDLEQVVLHRAATHNGICEDKSEGDDPVWECDCARGYEELPAVHFEFVNASQSMGCSPGARYPCDHVGPTAPNTSVVRISLKPEQYMVPSGSGRCIFGFMNADFMNWQGGGMWLLGDRFLSNRYTIYDYERGYVGFSDAIRKPPSWFQRNWKALALVCSGTVVLLFVASGLCKWRRGRRRTAVRMSVAIHWSDPLGDSPALL